MILAEVLTNFISFLNNLTKYVIQFKYLNKKLGFLTILYCRKMNQDFTFKFNPFYDQAKGYYNSAELGI